MSDDHAASHSQHEHGHDLPSSPAYGALAELGIIDLCQADGRPTLIFDLAQTGADLLRPLFLNNTLRASPRLLSQLVSKKAHGLLRYSHDRDHVGFVQWATNKDDLGKIPSLDTEAPPYVHRDFAWSRCTVKGRWRVISGLRVREIVNSTVVGSQKHSRKVFAVELHHSNYAAPEPETSLVPSIVEKENFGLDWTRSPPPPDLPAHVQFIRSVNWASTELGSMDTWPSLLRSMCNLIMADPTPASIFWGEHSNMIYNEAFISIAGQKHPALMGQHPAIPFAEVWDHFEGILEHCRSTGKAVKEENVCLFLERHGYPEETYVSFTFTPLVGDDDLVVGNYHTVHESTRTTIAQRRMSMLLKIGQYTATAQNLRQYWSQVMSALETNEQDVPFSILFSCTGSSQTDSESVASSTSSTSRQCIFEGSIGTADQLDVLPLMFDLADDSASFSSAFRAALRGNEPVLISADDPVFQSIIDLTPESDRRRGFGDPFKSAMICPLRPTNQKDAVGILVIGLNTRRPYDEDYHIFIDLLIRQLATSLASTLLYENERRRGLTAAEQAEEDQARLSAELSLRTEEIKRTEQRFTRLMQLAPIGVFIRDTAGQITYCNDTWYDLTGHTKSFDGQLSRIDLLKEATENSAGPQWHQLVSQKMPVTYETKTVREGRSPIQSQDESFDDAAWILTSAYPELSDDGNVKNIVGYITDITQQKWAEAVQQRLVKDAVESRRQQEYFIDMTSHEIRNPLSAIMHSADGILATLSNPALLGDKKIEDLVASSIDAAQTVLYCAQHQKNIVDDILTLSKLDSKLLVITPTLTYPTQLIEHTLKMFEAQFNTFDMKCTFDNQLGEDVDTAFLLDPSRLMQVLINLITNAIKFTKGEDEREIIVTLAKSAEAPSQSHSGIEYFPTKNSPRLEDRPGELYLRFSVSDTGCGLKTYQKDNLFQRFSQASPRTHVQYGGSGLGLFICREIVELQAGQIGVASTYGKGSTFGFYIRIQRPDKMRKGSSHSTADESPVTDLGVVAAGIAVPTVMQLPQEIPIPLRQREKAVAEAVEGTLKILIVEDNLVNQRVLSKQLTNQSCQVGIANHGQEAIDYIRNTGLWKGNEQEKRHDPDLSVILMDIEMPVMDGLTCTREIRRLQRQGTIRRHIPIIAVTANARKEQITEIQEAGLDQVISKPFRVVELVVLIKKTIAAVEKEPR